MKKKITTVITSSGQEALITKCKKIEGIYYLVGNNKIKDSGQCYIIKDSSGKETVYRAKNAKLIWDYELAEYTIKESQIYGIVDFVNGSFIEGFFTPNIYKNIDFRNGESSSIIPAINYDVIKKSGHEYDSFTYCWYKKGNNHSFERRHVNAIEEGYRKVNYPGFAEFYNAADHTMMKTLQETYDLYIKNKPDSPFDKYFNEYTIGAEVETCGGSVPRNDLFKYGLMPLRDGSIVGHEYTTCVIKNKYFATFSELFTSLQENCATNQNCSLHYHFGNIKKTKEFVVAFWFLYSRLEQNLETFCPPYKRNLQYLASKRVSGGTSRGAKDHCKRLPVLFKEYKAKDNKEVLLAYNRILNFLNQGVYPTLVDEKNLIYKHSQEGRNKWDYESRYYSVNLIPFLFERKQTIEFRFHSGTVNFYKSFAWALVCNALIQYAELNIEKILEGVEKIQLKDIFSVYRDDSKEGNFIYNWLNEYYENRSERFQELYIVNDIFGKEFVKDNSFVFKNKEGICPLTFKL